MKDHMQRIEKYLEEGFFHSAGFHGGMPAVFDLYLRVEQVKASRRIADALEQITTQSVELQFDQWGHLKVTTNEEE